VRKVHDWATLGMQSSFTLFGLPRFKASLSCTCNSKILRLTFPADSNTWSLRAWPDHRLLGRILHFIHSALRAMCDLRYVLSVICITSSVLPAGFRWGWQRESSRRRRWCQPSVRFAGWRHRRYVCPYTYSLSLSHTLFSHRHTHNSLHALAHIASLYFAGWCELRYVIKHHAL